MFSKTALILAILPFSYAASCTSASSKPWPIVFDPNDTAVETCHKACVNDVVMVSQQSNCVTKCLNLAGVGPDSKKLKLKARATTSLDCSSSETCYRYTDGSFLCLDPDTGKYHDDENGVGDVNTGAYASGAFSGGAGGAAQTSKTGTGAKTTAVRSTSGAAATSSLGTKATETTGSAASLATSSSVRTTSTGTGVAAVASVTPTGGVERVYAGGVVGVVGLVVGLVL